MRHLERDFGRSKLRGDRLLLVSLGAAILVACVSSWPNLEREEAYHRTDDVAQAGQLIGSEQCSLCHDSFAGHLVTSDQHAYCEACHGPGERHAYTAQAEDIRFPRSSDCIACHQGDHSQVDGFAQSAHARGGLLCSDCHDTHARELHLLRKPAPMQATTLPRSSEVTRLCSSCHAETAAQFDLPSHHPVTEGMLECTDCHTPHRIGELETGARTDTCAGCHQEVMGPWIYEHPPAAEDCSYCHVPHGATADDLLETPEPALCISCHTIATSGAVHDPFAFTTRCTDCHGAVHGSYADPHLRR